MPKKALTVAAVERVRPPERGQFELFDKGFPGLALRVSYAGGKSFGFYYRFGGKLKRINLGTYPAIGLLEAREAWRAARMVVAKGDDPGRRETVSRTDTVEAVVAEWIKRDQAPRNRASTVKFVEGSFRFDVLPAWGARQIRTISKRDVIELLDAVMGSRRRHQGSPALCVPSALFQMGLCARDYPDQSHDRRREARQGNQARARADG
jgi:hypothetical protein